MKNYQYIDLPNLNEISKIIFEHLPDEFKVNGVFKSVPVEPFALCAPLVEAVETITPWSNISSIAIITVRPGKRMPIHRDYETENSPYALNIPISNCVDTYTVFYKLLDNADATAVVLEETFGDYLNEYRPEDVEEIDRLYLHKAALFNTQVPHSAVNETDEQRIIISIRFKEPRLLFPVSKEGGGDHHRNR